MRTFNFSLALIVAGASVILSTLAGAPVSADPPPPSHHDRPTLGEFMGLNVHTVGFKPALYAPVCRQVRDYHPYGWDVGKDSSHPTEFPMAINRVDWGQMYGEWNKAGFEIDACVMFDGFAAKDWKNPAADGRAYGEAFAHFFGPSGKHPLVTSVEVGNEPSKYSEAEYRTIFEGMAHGLRAGDPKLKVVTCAVMTGKPDAWSKPMTAIAGLENLYDVINIHSYAFKDKWPTWRRSYPEDPSIIFLKEINNVIQWRDTHAPGKEIWLTEFGFDSASHPPDAKSEWKQWVGVTDEQQAQYIVRSFLVLSSMNIDRAYLYFFNDNDEAQLHGASGITRKYKPKPSFYAMSQVYKNLGDYRFVRAVEQKEGEIDCFEYAAAKKSTGRVFVAWSPTGSGKSGKFLLPLGKAAGTVQRAERMTLTADGAEKLEFRVVGDGVELEVGESPVFIWTK